MNLDDKTCIPCNGQIPPLSYEQKLSLKTQIDSAWQFTYENTRLYREFKFKNFQQSLDFAMIVGEIAEEQWHHPEIHIGYGHCGVEIWTHKLSNLVESDFIFAAKVDQIFGPIQ